MLVCMLAMLSHWRWPCFDWNISVGAGHVWHCSCLAKDPDVGAEKTFTIFIMVALSLRCFFQNFANLFLASFSFLVESSFRDPLLAVVELELSFGDADAASGSGGAEAIKLGSKFSASDVA